MKSDYFQKVQGSLKNAVYKDLVNDIFHNILARLKLIWEQAVTEEMVIDDLKQRVEAFYFILEAMLFDYDFGFIGYYRSVLNEPEFKNNQIREQLEQTLDSIKTLIQLS